MALPGIAGTAPTASGWQLLAWKLAQLPSGQLPAPQPQLRRRAAYGPDVVPFTHEPSCDPMKHAIT